MRYFEVYTLIFAFAAIVAPAFARADDSVLFPARDNDLSAGQVAHRSWERSLVPLLASQSLDAASSYGYGEMNPLLADANGRFGVKATTVKFGVVAVLIGVEYLIARKSPRAARLFSK